MNAPIYDISVRTIDGKPQALAKAIVAQMKGKRLPAIGRVDISIIEEDNPRLLAFDSGQTDYEKLPYTMTDRALADGKLKPEYAKRGINWFRVAEPGLIFAYFNMDDPVIGGYEKEKIALRRSMALGFNTEELIRVSFKGQAIPAVQPVPPNVSGHDPNAKPQLKYDPAAARALLDRFGYKDATAMDFVNFRAASRCRSSRAARPPRAIAKSPSCGK